MDGPGFSSCYNRFLPDFLAAAQRAFIAAAILALPAADSLFFFLFFGFGAAINSNGFFGGRPGPRRTGSDEPVDASVVMAARAA